MNKFMAVLALGVLIMSYESAQAQSQPQPGMGADVGTQASHGAADAANRAAQQAADEARKEKARAASEAEKKLPADSTLPAPQSSDQKK